MIFKVAHFLFLISLDENQTIFPIFNQNSMETRACLSVTLRNDFWLFFFSGTFMQRGIKVVNMVNFENGLTKTSFYFGHTVLETNSWKFYKCSKCAEKTS